MSEYKYYIRHNAKAGMTVHLSDQDSERIINLKTNQQGNEIIIYSKNNIYRAEIIEIGTSSVSVKILEAIANNPQNKISSKIPTIKGGLYNNETNNNPAEESKNLKSTNKIKSDNIKNRLMLLYSIIPEREYRYALEKAIEIGTDYIVPLVSGYSYINYFDAIKARNRWQEIVSDAIDQSRTQSAAILTGIVKIAQLDQDLDKYSNRYGLGDLMLEDADKKSEEEANDKEEVDVEKAGEKANNANKLQKNMMFSVNSTDNENSIKYNTERVQIRIALATENLNKLDFYQYVQTLKSSTDNNIDYIVAIGPEKGWDSNDIKILKENNFIFAQLGDNILRAESVGLAVGTIIKLTSNIAAK